MNNNVIVNADTDSIMISKPDGAEWSKEEQQEFLDSLNAQFPDKIKFEHDGYFSSVVVIKSKNYALLSEGSTKIKTKGSSIRDQKKEPALREMMDKMIDAMIFDKLDTIPAIYTEYIKEALNVKDIRRWSQKKTVTEAVMDCSEGEGRKNEQDVYKAVKDEKGLQQGDKIYVYPVILGYQIIPGKISEKTGKQGKEKSIEVTGLKMDKYWTEDHDVEKLVERVFSTVSIFKLVLDMSLIIDYTKVKNKPLLEQFKPKPEVK